MGFISGKLRRRQPGCYIIAAVKIQPGGDTIKTVKIIVYVATFAVVIAIAVAIAALSLAVAPAAAKSTFLGKIAIVLGGFAVTGGVVYLAEKLINVAKEVAYLVAEIIVERYKKSQLEAGIKIGREERQQAWQAWYQRQQSAQREGRTFTEPPPGYSPEVGANGQGHP